MRYLSARDIPSSSFNFKRLSMALLFLDPILFYYYYHLPVWKHRYDTYKLITNMKSYIWEVIGIKLESWQFNPRDWHSTSSQTSSKGCTLGCIFLTSKMNTETQKDQIRSSKLCATQLVSGRAKIPNGACLQIS